MEMTTKCIGYLSPLVIQSHLTVAEKKGPVQYFNISFRLASGPRESCNNLPLVCVWLKNFTMEI